MVLLRTLRNGGDTPLLTEDCTGNDTENHRLFQLPAERLAEMCYTPRRNCYTGTGPSHESCKFGYSSGIVADESMILTKP